MTSTSRNTSLTGVLWAVVRVVTLVILVVLTAWAAAALHFDSPWQGSLLALLYGGASVWLLWLARPLVGVGCLGWIIRARDPVVAQLEAYRPARLAAECGSQGVGRNEWQRCHHAQRPQLRLQDGNRLHAPLGRAFVRSLEAARARISSSPIGGRSGLPIPSLVSISAAITSRSRLKPA